MGAQISQNGAPDVVVRRSGHDSIAFHPPEGATLADVLRSLDIAPEEHTILIDGQTLAEVFVPPAGSVVTLFRKVGGEILQSQPIPQLGGFADDPYFEQMMEGVWAARGAERDDP